MSKPELSLEIEGGESGFRPGDTLRATVNVRANGIWTARGGTLDLLYWTEGQGDEDRATAHRETLFTKDQQVNAQFRKTFTLTAPQFPWSYHGNRIKIHWCLGLYVRAKGEDQQLLELPLVIHPRPQELLA
ncbi:MAG: hypothetical protein RLY93_06910 [Sumerlaeia bacterium]